MDAIESERRCGHVPGQNGGGTLVPARQGSGRLSLWCSAITYASMCLCRSVSQAEIGRNRCGRVWVRVELVSGAPGGNRGDQVVRIGNSGKGPLGEWARIKTGSRAEFVAQVVEEAGSPGECVCACVRGELAGVVA